MKKTILVIFILGSIFFGSFIISFAAEGNILVGSDEADEIMEDMEIILEDVKPENITQEDIEFHMDKIIRDYIDIDIFKNNIKTPDEMRAYLKDAKYLYLLPIFNKENGDYELMISRGLPVREGAYLTEDEIEHLEKRVGRWGSPAIGVCEMEEDPPILDYKLNMETFFNCYGIENSETFFVGGATTESVITAVCFTEDGEKEDDGPYYVALDKIDPAAQTKEEIEDAVFTYDEMKEYARVDYYGGGGTGEAKNRPSSSGIIILAAVVAAVAVVVIVVRKHKKA